MARSPANVRTGPMEHGPDLPPLPPSGSTPRGKPRPCARCRREFQPTISVRMLCGQCASYARSTGNGINGSYT